MFFQFIMSISLNMRCMLKSYIMHCLICQTLNNITSTTNFTISNVNMFALRIINHMAHYTCVQYNSLRGIWKHTKRASVHISYNRSGSITDVTIICFVNFKLLQNIVSEREYLKQWILCNFKHILFYWRVLSICYVMSCWNRHF